MHLEHHGNENSALGHIIFWTQQTNPDAVEHTVLALEFSNAAHRAWRGLFSNQATIISKVIN